MVLRILSFAFGLHLCAQQLGPVLTFAAWSCSHDGLTQSGHFQLPTPLAAIGRLFIHETGLYIQYAVALIFRPSESVLRPSESVLRPSESVLRPSQSVLIPSESVLSRSDSVLRRSRLSAQTIRVSAQTLRVRAKTLTVSAQTLRVIHILSVIPAANSSNDIPCMSNAQTEYLQTLAYKHRHLDHFLLQLSIMMCYLLTAEVSICCELPCVLLREVPSDGADRC